MTSFEHKVGKEVRLLNNYITENWWDEIISVCVTLNWDNYCNFLCDELRSPIVTLKSSKWINS